jgi:putative RecB family exonuclease
MRFVRGSISPLGGCVVSDVVSVSPTRLATYATCPRQYEFSHVQNVSSPDETKFYMYQGRIYHETIETVCDQTGRDDDAMTIYERALDAFDEKWAEYIDPSEYVSAAHQEYQRREILAGIKAFFDPEGGVGLEHARTSVATEKWIECERDGLGLHGYTDNVLRDGDTLHLVDYKRNVRGVLGEWSADRLIDHLESEAHEAKRVKNAFQTAAYVEGIKDSSLYEPGMTVRFSFYGLLHNTDVESTPTGYEIAADGRQRETTGAYEEYHDTIWALIEAAHDGITSETYQPDPFELIREQACDDCEYQAMCPEYLSPEDQQ